MKFKELYPLIAKQHAEHCPVQGQTVSLGSMAWLMKIQLALEEIAINRDGLWQLKETASVPDDGQQSDEQVWAYPI